MINIDYKEVFAIIDSLSLSSSFKFVLNNGNNLSLPYHNMNHTLQMMYHIIQSNKEYNFDITIFKSLMLASLFHDYNHSGGKLSDEKNVDNAKSGLLSHYDNKDLDMSFVISLIDSTQYPYIIDECDLSIYQKIMRDCDILVSFNSDYFTQRLLGLKEELNITDIGKLFDDEEVFLRKSFSQLRTSYAIKVLSENIVDFTEYNKKLKEVCNIK